MSDFVSLPLKEGVGQRSPADLLQIRTLEPASQITPQEGTVVFDPEKMTAEERRSHYIAEQFALGPLGDPVATARRFRLPEKGGNISDEIPFKGSLAETTHPWDEEVIDPIQAFSSPEEFTTLFSYYRSRLTPEQRAAISVAEEEGYQEDLAIRTIRQELKELAQSTEEPQKEAA